MTEIKSYQMGFMSWLQLMFIGLKLTGYITWAWFWVLSPFIVTLGIVGILIIIFIIIMIKEFIWG